MLQNILIDGRIPEISVSYSHPIKNADRIKITSLLTALDVLRTAWNGNTIELCESFKVMLINRHNRLLGVASIAEGGITNTVVDVRILFAVALKTSAVSIILAHNHPSGNIKPSKSDQLLTQKIVEGARILEIEVLDHIILTRESHFSFLEEGMMPHLSTVKNDQLNSEDF